MKLAFLFIVYHKCLCVYVCVCVCLFVCVWVCVCVLVCVCNTGHWRNCAVSLQKTLLLSTHKPWLLLVPVLLNLISEATCKLRLLTVLTVSVRCWHRNILWDIKQSLHCWLHSSPIIVFIHHSDQLSFLLMVLTTFLWEIVLPKTNLCRWWYAGSLLCVLTWSRFWNECFSANNLCVGIGLNIVDLVSLIAPYVWAVGTFLVCFSESSR